MKKLLSFVFALFLFLTLYGKSEESHLPKKELVGMTVDSSEFEKGVFERESARYRELLIEFRQDLEFLIEREIKERERIINDRYSKIIAEEEEKEDAYRRDAIKLFEEFIKKYPNNHKYTPNAMYRLAELYYERSVVKYYAEDSKYQTLLAQHEKNNLLEEIDPPLRDFGDSIKLYKTIIEKFPDFQYLGAVYYLLGYCYTESGDAKKAVAVWLELIDKKIESPYLAELYMRLGDYYFDDSVLDKAEHYYKEGMQFTESDFFDKLLYKYAWTFYRISNFEKAVDLFTQLLFFADEMKKIGLDKGQDLRKEAIQYIAISFSDDEWGSVDKAIEYFNKIEADSFEREVFEQIGKYYYDNNSFEQAEKAYRHILQRHPYHETAPKVHHRLILLYGKSRNFDKVAEETEIFAKLYDPSEEWARINRGNATLVKEATELAKNSLLETASYRHRQAQAYAEKGEREAAVNEYRTAAVAYGTYLMKFPYISDSYDITYNFADTLFQSGDIDMAVVVYERIRDDKNQNKYKGDAAYQTFVCYNILWEKSPEKLVGSEEKEGKPFSNLEKKLIESSDIYFETATEVDDKPAIAYSVAKIFWNHGKYEDAEKRYLRIINEFPESEMALLAARDIISTHSKRGDWVSVAKWSKLLEDRLSAKKRADDKLVRGEFETYRGTALFKNAQKLEEEKEFLEASEEYLRIVEETPYFKEADAALYNAAINLSRATRYESALQIHERVYKEYPYSQFAPKSLYLTAYNAEKSYDHEKAISAYKLLYEKYPTDEKKNDAIICVAELLEKLQRYREASRYYTIFYTEKKYELEGKEALYLAGRMYYEAKEWTRMIKNHEDFINTFKSDSEMMNLVAKAYSEIANVYEEKLNNRKKARDYYRELVAFFEGSSAVTDEFVKYVSEAKFKLLEDDYNAYLKMKIGGKNEKQSTESYMKKLKAKDSLEGRYIEIVKLQILDWVTASMYRLGRLYQNFADSFYEAEIPKGLTEEEALQYEEELRKSILPLEERAIDNYTRGLERARELKVFNRWTQLMTERLSVMNPALYRVGKPPVFAVESDIGDSFPPMLSLDNVEKKKYKKAGASGADTESKEETP
ncbi:MAG: tetratricopeptide repeat protein [bacterium]